MISLRCFRRGLRHRRTIQYNYFSSINVNKPNILCKYFKISEHEAEYMRIKQPAVTNLCQEKLKELIDTIHEIGWHKEVLLKKPILMSAQPVTLKFRFQVLNECGIVKVRPSHLSSYLSLVKQKTIGDLKRIGELSSSVNIENRLASFMTQWPTSLTTLVYGDVDEFTLYSLRLKIIQRYLELVLDLTEDEFHRGMQTYPTIKHRPLQMINETLTILQSQLMMPLHKIKSNLYLIHSDPENLKQIIYNFRSIGGIDIKEVIRMHPRIATKKYSTLVETRNILKEHGITDEAQRRCFDIFTLGPSTVKERLETAKEIPEFQAFFNHPRFLKIIHYKATAMKRLVNLYDKNKKCISLNILSGSSAHYESFVKAPGDRAGKVKDLVFCISQSLGDKFRSSEIQKMIKRHPFWLNIQIIQVKSVYNKLSAEYTPNDIYENCLILLYPWSKIKETMNLFEQSSKQNLAVFFQDQLDSTKISKSQKLSLILYILEKKHYFSGNGVWIEEKTKNVMNVSNSQDLKFSSVQ